MIKTKIFNSRSNETGRIDVSFLILVLVISLFGTFTVFTAGSAYALKRYGDSLYFMKRQVLWLITGLVAMFLSSRISTKKLRDITPLLYGVTLLLLILTLIVGFVGNGAKRWIAIGPITLQPSEIAKLTMVMMLARYFSTHTELTHSKRGKFIYGTLFPALIMIVPILLVMLQKHLSCIIILGLIGISLIVLSGVSLKYLGYFSLAGAVGVSYIAFFTEYTKERITVWRNPEAYKLSGGWQTLQGLMAIGSGGLFGKGIGNGELKYSYVSEPANDMIYAILCEEMGLIGALLVIFLFALLIHRGFEIALSAKDEYSRLLCLGICMKVAIQVLLNIAVVTNTIPNTGISLPFFSYGGSSLVMLLFEMGIILSISRSSRLHKG